MMTCLPEDSLLRLLQLAIFPGTFDTIAAMKILGASWCGCLVLSFLQRLNLLSLAQHETPSDRWRLHSSVVSSARQLADQLSLPLIATRHTSYLPPYSLAVSLTNQSFFDNSVFQPI